MERAFLHCAKAVRSSSYPITLVLLVSNVNISPSSSSEAPALALGETRRLSRGREPFVLILKYQVTSL
jgi:hypothetical protein